MKTLAFILRSLFTALWQLALGVPVLLLFVLGFFLARGIDDDFAYNVYHTFLLLSEVLGPLAGLYLLDRSMKKETEKRKKAEEGGAKEAVAKEAVAATREEPALAVEDSTPASEEPAPSAAEEALTEEESALPAYVAPAVVDFEPTHYNPTTGLPMVDESSGIDVGGHLLDEVDAPVQMQLFN